MCRRYNSTFTRVCWISLPSNQPTKTYFTAECQLIMTPEEYVIQAKEDAQQEKLCAERLASKLRELNIDPDSL